MMAPSVASDVLRTARRNGLSAYPVGLSWYGAPALLVAVTIPGHVANAATGSCTWVVRSPEELAELLQEAGL
jgi:hypothetical protein